LISVRLATLADTATIVNIHRTVRSAQVPGLDFDDLTLIERWHEAGAWGSIETGAVHLNRMLAGSAIPLVAEVDGQVIGEAEVYESFEPTPFGHHLHVAVLVSDPAQAGSGAAALINYITEMARLMKCDRVTAAAVEESRFYSSLGFRQSSHGHGVRFSAQEGRAFYQASEFTDRSYDQVKDWFMPLGRYQSSHYEWDKLFPQDWVAGIPELLNIATLHIRLTVTGQNAMIFFREGDQPGEITVACWSARPLTNPLLTAIRDRAFRDGYQTLVTYVLDSDLPLLGTDVQQSDYVQIVYELLI
jgi:GNAT superfamily N-acetyltransferase